MPEASSPLSTSGIMKATVILAVSSLWMATGQAAEHCDSLGTLLYDELGCSPTRGGDGCPTSYDCSRFSVAGGVCRFRGAEYRGGEVINGTSGCNRGCYCQGEGSGTACAIVDCYHGPKINADCYDTFKLHGCCAAGQKCPPFEDAATCQVDGKTFREGEIFVPKGTCMACVCGKGFAGRYVEPFCERIRCDVELEAAKIGRNCAPAYRKNAEARCCPSYYVCSEKSTIQSFVKAAKESDKKCKFGNDEYNVDDSLTLKYTYGFEREANCTCILPPFMTCTLSY